MNLNDFLLILTLKHSFGSASDNMYSHENKLKTLNWNEQITQAPLYTFYSRLVAWCYVMLCFIQQKVMMHQNGRHNDWNYLLFGMNQASALVRWVGVRTLCVLIQCWSWLQPISVLASTLCLLLVLESALCILLMPFWLCFWLGISWMDPFV